MSSRVSSFCFCAVRAFWGSFKLEKMSHVSQYATMYITWYSTQVGIRCILISLLAPPHAAANKRALHQPKRRGSERAPTPFCQYAVQADNMATGLFGWGAPAEPVETVPPAPLPAAEPVKLTLNVAAGPDTSAELSALRAQIRALEQRVSREAQTWAEQRAELLREITAKDEALWAMMQERQLGVASSAAAGAPGGKGSAAAGTGSALPKPKKKAAASPAKKATAVAGGTAAAGAAGTAAGGKAGGVAAKAGAAAAKPGAAAGAGIKKKAAGATATKGTKGKAVSAAAKKSAVGAAAGAAAAASAAGSAGVGVAAANAAEASTEGPPLADISDGAAPGYSTLELEESVADAGNNAGSADAAAAGSSSSLEPVADTATPTAGEPGAEAKEGAPAQPAKSPLKGFRPKPNWVPTLEIRLAMVKSPRKKKPAAGGAAAAAGGTKPAAKKAGIGAMKAKATVKV